MARMPGAKWRPISRNYTKRATTKNCIILHTTASATATSMHGWFNNPSAQASSHFHVDFNGNIEQYIDTAYMSWANSSANPRSITIETQGGGSEAWTSKQISAIVKIIQWARRAHPGIPLRQMSSSSTAQKGIGWHRLGVRGNFPKTGILRGLTQRGVGQVWSSAYGKTCPGDRRIQQIPSIVKKAGGASHSASGGSSTTSKTYRRKRVKSSKAKVTANRGTNRRVVGSPGKGYRLNIVKTQGSWTQVRWKFDGAYRNAWIPTAHLNDFFEDQVNSKGEIPVNKVHRTKRDRVPVRSGRSTSGSKNIVGYMFNKGYRTNVIKRTGKYGSWAMIRFEGKNRWVVWNDLV